LHSPRFPRTAFEILQEHLPVDKQIGLNKGHKLPGGNNKRPRDPRGGTKIPATLPGTGSRNTLWRIVWHI
jgi:hypothetical protein